MPADDSTMWTKREDQLEGERDCVSEIAGCSAVARDELRCTTGADLRYACRQCRVGVQLVLRGWKPCTCDSVQGLASAGRFRSIPGMEFFAFQASFDGHDAQRFFAANPHIDRK